MNKQEKIEFIETLMEGLKTEILVKVDQMPENWEGWELRQYIADKASECVWSTMKNAAKKRSYNNDIRVNNL